MKNSLSLPQGFLALYFNNQCDVVQSCVKRFFAESTLNSGKVEVPEKVSKPTKVYFYKQLNNKILAVFPFLRWNEHYDDGDLIACYEIYPTAIEREYLQDCKLASKQEYEPLVNELRSLGYDLEVLNWY